MRTLICVLCTSLSFTSVRADTTTPIDTVQAYFSWTLLHRANPLPSRKEGVQLAKWLTPVLMNQLNTACMTQERCIRAAPQGEKPNVLEGDIFVGNEGGVTEAAYQVPKQMGGKTVVAVDLVYVDKRRPKGDRLRAVAWRAEVTLVATGGRWYVEDIRYAPDRSLRATLQSYNDDGARECATP